ncbi:hypothetical protein DFP72DRAFT_61709 [Ephemerocybe angulata]|uniref:Uncharacterized protein n=1 Tax=Ephemerocybe angulata TaxID=980116 RepID=A0A8H6HFR2_9AGAR|nr:hypothetical protein DFP72DRAFT_61709 [Tulosesus angulatus]
MIPAAFAERFLWNSRKEEEIEPIVDSSPPPPADVAEQAKNLNKDEPDRITPAALPSFTFSDGVLAELNSFVSLAFSKAEVAQTTLLDATDDETAPVEKCVVLSCTQRHGTPILDAAVRYVAEKHKAEVLVLDAFEIASGKLGVLGKSGEVIDELYEAILSGERPSKETETEGSPPEDEVSGEPTNVRVGAQEEPKEQDTSVTTSSNSETKVVAVGPEDGKTEVAGGDNANLEGEVPESDPSVAGKEKVERREQEATETPSLDQRTRSLFDALLATSCSSSGKGDEETHPERRIVYMREFDIIQGAAKPLMAHILQSLHESRQRARLSGSHLPQNTIIVFGLNATPEVQLSIGNKPNSSQKNCLFLSGLFTSARSAISIKLHRSHYITCNCTACQVGRGTSPQVSLDNVPVGSDFWGERVDAMVAARLTMPVFSTNVKYGAYQEEWQKEGKRIRGRELNQRVLWACLERDGSVGFEKLESEVPDIESL